MGTHSHSGIELYMHTYFLVYSIENGIENNSTHSTRLMLIYFNSISETV